MIIEIIVPQPGESINEVEIANWLVENGDIVEKDKEIAEMESDKASLPLIATEGGKLQIIVEAGSTVNVGSVACKIDTSFAGSAPAKSESPDPTPKAKEKTREEPIAKETPKKESQTLEVKTDQEKIKLTPLAKKMMETENISIDDVLNGLKRIGKSDVEMAVQANAASNNLTKPAQNRDFSRSEERTKLSSLRKKLSKRLVAVKNETAMLTTFNEVDMSKVMEMRKKYQNQFIEKHGVKLGFMSFFTKAAALALEIHPNVNAMMDGDEFIFHHFSDIGIAVQTPKGLMVPVIRNAESLSLNEIESNLLELAGKARKGRISLDDLSGGTFTITNGGVFGSLLSTPIINPPQAAILGMHNIVERPMAINGKVEIRPMMYLALSYDHRIIDGKDSVGFQVKIKEFIENPEKMLFPGRDASELLLNL